MKSLGQRAAGERLERMRASLRWVGDGFRNLHPVLAGLRDTSVPRPTVSDFLCGGARRVPNGPLPSLDPRPLWARPVDSGLRATWLGHSTVLAARKPAETTTARRAESPVRLNNQMAGADSGAPLKP